MTDQNNIPDADDMRAQLALKLAEVEEQQALLQRMQRGRESQISMFVQDTERRYAALTEKERLVNQKIDVLERLIARLEASTNPLANP
jgi:hypothetical protein